MSSARSSKSSRLTVETEFPAKVQVFDPEAAKRSRTFGAHGEMELSTSDIHQNNSSKAGSIDSPSAVKYRREEETFLPKTTPQKTSIDVDDDDLPGVVYKTTTVVPPSEASMSNSQRAYGKFVEVYSNSGDTVEFARNVSHAVDDIVSPYVWICIYATISVFSIAMITIGALHATHCSINHLIPTWLIVAGAFYIVECGLRIYSTWPLPEGARHSSSLMAGIVRKGIELLIVFFLVVWLILGCVWVYGARANVQFAEHMFDDHYCDYELYWFAWWTVTIHLILIALALLLAVGIVFLGICKENQGRVLR